MEKKTKQSEESYNKTKKVNKTMSPGNHEPEFAEELTSSDVKSAFKNPITGEERLY